MAGLGLCGNVLSFSRVFSSFFERRIGRSTGDSLAGSFISVTSVGVGRCNGPTFSTEVCPKPCLNAAGVTAFVLFNTSFCSIINVYGESSLPAGVVLPPSLLGRCSRVTTV